MSDWCFDGFIKKKKTQKLYHTVDERIIKFQHLGLGMLNRNLVNDKIFLISKYGCIYSAEVLQTRVAPTSKNSNLNRAAVNSMAISVSSQFQARCLPQCLLIREPCQFPGNMVVVLLVSI